MYVQYPVCILPVDPLYRTNVVQLYSDDNDHALVTSCVPINDLACDASPDLSADTVLRGPPQTWYRPTYHVGEIFVKYGIDF